MRTRFAAGSIGFLTFVLAFAPASAFAKHDDGNYRKGPIYQVRGDDRRDDDGKNVYLPTYTPTYGKPVYGPPSTPPPSAPEPASLFAIGLVGLGVLRRRRG